MSALQIRGYHAPGSPTGLDAAVDSRTMRVLTDHVYPDLIDLLQRAKRFLLLVSPYWDLTDRLKAELERAEVRGVQLILIARGGTDREAQEKKLHPIRQLVPRAPILFVERLHAKIYLSESEAIVTSLNLVESSAVDSIEAGVRFTQSEHPEQYEKLRSFAERLIGMGTQDQQRSRPSPAAEPPRTRPAAEPPRSRPATPRERPQEKPHASRRRPQGHCIRCADDIDLNDERPLCGDCYAIWAEYKNPDYEERHCHACGRESATSMSKPLCRACWKRSTA